MKYENYNGKLRNSNLELLRIFCMLMIIAHHFAVHGGFDLSVGEFNLRRFFIQILFSGGKLGVNIFVLITGYFMINKEFSIKKLIKLIFEIYFYSLLILILFKDYSLANLKLSFFPISHYLYWFASCYVLLYLFTIFINEGIKKLEAKVLLRLILFFSTLWSFYYFIGFPTLEFSELVWFLNLYLIGAYIRLHSINILRI